MRNRTWHLTAAPGQMLLEVTIAVGLFAVSFISLFPYLYAQLDRMRTTEGTIRASAYAEEGLLAARAIRDRDWNALVPGTHGIALIDNAWALEGTSDTSDDLERVVTITDLSTNERQVTARVVWNRNAASPGSLRLTTIFADWHNIPAPLLNGNWANPQTLGSVDLGPGNEATGLAVKNGMVYLTAHAADAKKKDLYIVDATNGQAPVLKGSVHSGTGLEDLVLQLPYAFAANSQTSQQLQWFQVSNPDSPELLGGLKLTGNNEPARAIAATGSLLFVGTSVSASGPELFVINATDPLNPTISGSLEIGADVNKIFAYQDRIYLATGKDAEELVIVDASNSAMPTKTGFYDASGTQDGLGLFVNPQDGRLYLTRRAGSASIPEVVILSVGSLDAPALIGTLALSADVNAVLAADALLFLGTSTANEEFKVYDATIASALTWFSGLNFPQLGTDIALEDNTIYMSVRSNDALRIITSQ